MTKNLKPQSAFVHLASIWHQQKPLYVNTSEIMNPKIRRLDAMFIKLLFFSILTLLICMLPSMAGDLAYGEYLAGECVACHRIGVDGGIPPINSLPAPYFVEALKEYRDGERDHDLMRTVARSLGDAEMNALAAYFEKLDVQN